MRNILVSSMMLVLIWSCTKEQPSNFILKGSVKNLKKGIVYLQKDGDSGIISLDSAVISGNPNFTLSTNLNEPILLYLKLFKNDGEEHYIPFFADTGTTEINTSLKNFSFDAQIKGSEQQKLLNDYIEVMRQYNNQNLDLLESIYNAQKNNDSILADSLKLRSSNLRKRKYSYTIQYALNNNDSEVAPYLALYEIPKANPIYLDSIYKGLTDAIKQSYYGEKLRVFLSKESSEE